MSPMQFMYPDLNLSSLSENYPDLSVRQVTLLTHDEEKEMKRLTRAVQFSKVQHQSDWEKMRALEQQINALQSILHLDPNNVDILNKFQITQENYKKLHEKEGMKNYILDNQQVDALIAKKTHLHLIKNTTPFMVAG